MMDMILDSRDFGARLIEKDTLLPAIYKYEWPDQFKKCWDQTRDTWKPTFVQPNLLSMGGFIKTKYLKKNKDVKKNAIVLSIQSGDSAFTQNLAMQYLNYLNEYIRTKVQAEAKENVTYLDSELVNIADPLLRSKILNLLSSEIEKEMIVSREAFKIEDPLFLHKTFKEKKLFPLVFGFGLFFVSCLMVLFMHAVTSSQKSEEDLELMAKIRKELTRLPFAGKK